MPRPARRTVAPSCSSTYVAFPLDVLAHLLGTEALQLTLGARVDLHRVKDWVGPDASELVVEIAHAIDAPSSERQP